MTVSEKMATAGIEVRRSNPSVATIWVAELLAAANRQADELENRKTHESIQQMFGKITPCSSNPKLSYEEVLCNKITKQKKKNAEKEKEYQLTVKAKKKKKEFITNGVSKTEYITEKQKASTLGSVKKTIPSIESIKSRLEDKSISRSARKKLKRKLKELQSQGETTELKVTSVQNKKKFPKLLQNKTDISSSTVQKKHPHLTNGHQQPDISTTITNGHQEPDVSTTLTNGHQQPDVSTTITNGHPEPDISTTLTNGHQDCPASTAANGFKMTNTTIPVSTKQKVMQPNDLQPPLKKVKQKKGQLDGDVLQSPLKKSKLAKKIQLITELLKKQRKKKRSKQKNIKKDNRPDDMKPPHLLKMKTTNGNLE